MNFVPPTRPYGAYLFDFDGTLVDSMPLHYRAWGAALDDLGVDFDFPPELFLSLAGTETKRLVALLNERFNLTLEIEPLMLAKRRYFDDNVERLERILEVCEWAFEVKQHAPVAIVTGGYRDMVVRSMQATGLDQLTDVLVTFQDVPNGKPAPDMFLLAAEQLGVDPGECLVIEDGELGVQGAEAAGMDTLFIERVPELV